MRKGGRRKAEERARGGTEGEQQSGREPQRERVRERETAFQSLVSPARVALMRLPSQVAETDERIRRATVGCWHRKCESRSILTWRGRSGPSPSVGFGGQCGPPAPLGSFRRRRLCRLKYGPAQTESERLRSELESLNLKWRH